MNQWKLHLPDDNNQITRYRCGLNAGQHVRLKKDLVVMTFDGKPTGQVYRSGEVWLVLAGIASDPVIRLRQADGELHTWDDDTGEVDEWFDRLP